MIRLGDVEPLDKLNSIVYAKFNNVKLEKRQKHSDKLKKLHYIEILVRYRSHKQVYSTLNKKICLNHKITALLERREKNKRLENNFW